MDESWYFYFVSFLERGWTWFWREAGPGFGERLDLVGQQKDIIKMLCIPGPLV